MALVHQAVVADLNARRAGNASTLTRGEVSMTTAKAFRQKGTGRARAGALSTPNRYGGGVAFGPKPRSYTNKVNRKARKKALRAALSVHADRGTLAVCDPSAYDTPSTKVAAAALADFGTGRALLVVGSDDANCAKSFRNLKGVKVNAADNVGVADVIGAARLIVTPTALEHLTGVAS
jgi:large subunit ribosomal protein L4